VCLGWYAKGEEEEEEEEVMHGLTVELTDWMSE